MHVAVVHHFYHSFCLFTLSCARTVLFDSDTAKDPIFRFCLSCVPDCSFNGGDDQRELSTA